MSNPSGLGHQLAELLGGQTGDGGQRAQCCPCHAENLPADMVVVSNVPEGLAGGVAVDFLGESDVKYGLDGKGAERGEKEDRCDDED